MKNSPQGTECVNCEPLGPGDTAVGTLGSALCIRMWTQVLPITGAPLGHTDQCSWPSQGFVVFVLYLARYQHLKLSRPI